MVLGHQQSVHNPMTSTNYYVRTILHAAAESNKSTSRPGNPLSQSEQDRIGLACEKDC